MRCQIESRKVKHIDTDICIVGGGPSGLATAIWLAKLGHRVTLIDNKFERQSRRIESISANVIALINSLDTTLWPLIKGEPVNFIETQWGDLQTGHENSSDDPRWWLVDRERVRAVLSEMAASHQVRILSGARAFKPSQSSDGIWNIPVKSLAGLIEISSPILIEATGRLRILPGRQRLSNASLIAFSTSWHVDQWNQPLMSIQAHDQYWTWSAISGRSQTMNFTIFTDDKFLRQFSSEEKMLMHVSKNSCNVSNIQLVENTTNIVKENASGYIAKVPATKNRFTIGSACLSIDPVLSCGQYISFLTAFQCAIAVNTVITVPENTNHALSFYLSSVENMANQFSKSVGEIYCVGNKTHDTKFWVERTGYLEKTPKKFDVTFAKPLFPNHIVCGVQLSENTKVIEMPVISGDLISVKEAIMKPEWDRPVAYLGNLEIVPLLKLLAGEKNLASAIPTLRHLLGIQNCELFLEFIKKNGILSFSEG